MKYVNFISNQCLHDQNINNLIIGVAHNGVSRIGVENQEVLIIGAGAIGLLATAVSKAQNIY